MANREQVVSDIDLDAMDTRARTTAHFSPAPGPIALANDVLALIARVREQEQEQEIARLRSALEEQQQRAMGQLWAHDQVQHP